MGIYVPNKFWKFHLKFPIRLRENQIFVVVRFWPHPVQLTNKLHHFGIVLLKDLVISYDAHLVNKVVCDGYQQFCALRWSAIKLIRSISRTRPNSSIDVDTLLQSQQTPFHRIQTVAVHCAHRDAKIARWLPLFVISGERWRNGRRSRLIEIKLFCLAGR